MIPFNLVRRSSSIFVCALRASHLKFWRVMCAHTRTVQNEPKKRRKRVSNPKECEHRICQRPIRLTFAMRNKALTRLLPPPPSLSTSLLSYFDWFVFQYFLCRSHSRCHIGILSLPFSASHLHAILVYCFREIDDVVFIAVAVVVASNNAERWR